MILSVSVFAACSCLSNDSFVVMVITGACGCAFDLQKYSQQDDPHHNTENPSASSELHSFSPFDWHFPICIKRYIHKSVLYAFCITLFRRRLSFQPIKKVAITGLLQPNHHGVTEKVLLFRVTLDFKLCVSAFLQICPGIKLFPFCITELLCLKMQSSLRKSNRGSTLHINCSRHSLIRYHIQPKRNRLF